MAGKSFNLSKGVLSFNGRKGNVIPKDGDYTADQVGSANKELGNLTDYQKALYNIGGKPNDNLLDNWYFVGGGSHQGYGSFPVNQRGNTNYSGYAQTSIDRWILQYETDLELLADCVRLSKSWGMWQVLPLSAGTYTFSVLIANRSGSVRIYAASDDNTEYGTKYIDGSDSDGLYSTTFTIQENLQNVKINIGFLGGENQVDIIAVKLERGDKQTLGWKDSSGKWNLFETPKFINTLMACKFYFERIGGFPYNILADVQYAPSGATSVKFTVRFEGKRLNNPAVQFSSANQYKVYVFNISGDVIGANDVEELTVDQSASISTMTIVTAKLVGSIVTDGYCLLQGDGSSSSAWIDINADL